MYYEKRESRFLLNVSIQHVVTYGATILILAVVKT
jgi:hypothetical protein